MSDPIQVPSANCVNTEERLSWLASQLEAGFEEFRRLKRKGLDLALHHGPHLLEWKRLVGHGSWQRQVREKVKGADLRTCNRWKKIAENKAVVEDALARWPEVRWGLLKMLAFLSGKFDPSRPGHAEDDVGGAAAASAEEQGQTDASVTDLAGDDAVGEGGSLDPGAERQENGEINHRPVVPFQAARQVRPARKATARPGRLKPPATPASSEVVEYEVEVVQVFKVVVPRTVSEESVKKACEGGELRLYAGLRGKAWKFSDEGMKPCLNHVRPW